MGEEENKERGGDRGRKRVVSILDVYRRLNG